MSFVFKILPTTQQYDWGKIGSSSKVAQFAYASKIPDFTIGESTPYAELWMGTHPTSPSRVLSSNQTLSEYLASRPELIGQRIIKKFDASNGNLPFLFKVLAIEKALSIQTHPDKQTAEKLHAEQPHIYKDPNHKPEMALALTPFHALCGFLPLPQIAAYLRATPELTALIPPAIIRRFLDIAGSQDPAGPAEKSALKDIFTSLMMADEVSFRYQINVLVARYKSGGAREGESQDIVDLVLRLGSQFPGDIGVFCAFFLNYISLKPGEAIFLGAGEPHAYISGDIIECMANSDNVIRAGLTPKLRDVPNLISVLTYAASPPTKHAVYPVPLTSSNDAISIFYDPLVPEFSVVQIKLPPGKMETYRGVDGPSIAIVTEGEGFVEWGASDKERLGLGDVFFIGAGTKITFNNTQTQKEHGELVVYRAFVEAD